MEKAELDRTSEPDAIERAIEFGVDITLLQENLKRTPAERLRKAQEFLDSVVAFQSQVRSYRAVRKLK
jgi:hypothetical protein